MGTVRAIGSVAQPRLVWMYALIATPFELLKKNRRWARLVPRKEEIVVDTMTYASVAVLPWSIAQDRAHPALPEVELIRLDFSMIKR
jgi:hypothetical protein